MSSSSDRILEYILVLHDSDILILSFVFKLLDCVWRGVPKEKDRTAKQYIRVAFDRMADSINLPPYGAVEQVEFNLLPIISFSSVIFRKTSQNTLYVQI